MKGSLTRVAERSHLTGAYKHVIGVDEAGRGPLCGPVVCAACLVEGDGSSLEGIVDSKATTEEAREEAFEALIANKHVTYGVGIVSNKEIDRVNILQATMNGMTLAVNDLLSKRKNLRTDQLIVLVDGNRIPQDMPCEAKYIIKGDATIFSIAAASIIAKVTRDRLMLELDRQYPQYLIAKHKGYPTAEHRALLWLHGPTPIYRMTFGPCRDAAIKHGIKGGSSERAKKGTTNGSGRSSSNSSIQAGAEIANNKGAWINGAKAGGKKAASTSRAEMPTSSSKNPSKKAAKVARSKRAVLLKKGLVQLQPVRRSARLQQRE
jgi:ribonuclease HII